jgi:hypothetical protein
MESNVTAPAHRTDEQLLSSSIAQHQSRQAQLQSSETAQHRGETATEEGDVGGQTARRLFLLLEHREDRGDE